MLPEAKEFYENFWLAPKTHPLGMLKQARRSAVIKNFLRKTNSLNLLIVGCGSQTDMFIAADKDVFPNKGIVVAFDLSYNSIKIAKTNYEPNKYLVADALNLPFKTKSFDCVICSEVLEHLADPRRAILEFHRVLQNNGHLIVTVPNWISWYGLARKVAELFLKRPITSANQPTDNWYTYTRLKRIMVDKFNIKAKQGIWYFPPTGRGMRVISSKITVPVYKLFQPIERLLEVLAPKCGHMLALWCIKRRENG